MKGTDSCTWTAALLLLSMALLSGGVVISAAQVTSDLARQPLAVAQGSAQIGDVPTAPSQPLTLIVQGYLAPILYRFSFPARAHLGCGANVASADHAASLTALASSVSDTWRIQGLETVAYESGIRQADRSLEFKSLEYNATC